MESLEDLRAKVIQVDRLIADAERTADRLEAAVAKVGGYGGDITHGVTALEAVRRALAEWNLRRQMTLKQIADMGHGEN